jgi:hypothetical protein
MTMINLNTVRKDRNRADEKAKADENAIKHGRTKAQRMLETMQAAKARKTLDQAKFETE